MTNAPPAHFTPDLHSSFTEITFNVALEKSYLSGCSRGGFVQRMALGV